MPSNWAAFQALCRTIGGRDSAALASAVGAQLMPQMIEQAAATDTLPALAVRCFAQPDVTDNFSEQDKQRLRDALLENTQRNMRIIAQCLSLIRTLNDAGITPLLLKGSAHLLTINREQAGFRQQADIDLIVPPDSLLAAGEALQADGYRFYRNYRPLEIRPGIAVDTRTAIDTSTVHHHLPPLVKEEQAAFVELHRHFLPRRFQDKIPLEPLFDGATEQQAGGATFLVPSPEYQVIHIILGKLLHDGYLAACQFPIREACDYIGLREAAPSFDSKLVSARCGKAFHVFDQLVNTLMGYRNATPPPAGTSIRYRTRLMRMRYNYPAPATLLDLYARAQHLTYTAVYNPSKLAKSLRR
jgi:putative nucleotidyltransferase-like protein